HCNLARRTTADHRWPDLWFYTLTFELPDSARQCFHEPLQRGLKFTLDFQVITGGHYDVDCYVEDPNGKTLYKEAKKQYDSFSYRAEVAGIYTFCFSNEFSTFSHKTVYFDFQVGDEPPILPDMNHRVTALTQVSRVPLAPGLSSVPVGL
uniref:Transmembrane p24 trafficking protein 3 n=1 Tax=Chelonoidis abingdonii TaxID=106734 RepID=A0A8C0GWV3_CHEAB